MSKVFIVQKKFIYGAVGASVMLALGAIGILLIGSLLTLALPQFIAVCLALTVGAALAGMFIGMLIPRGKTLPVNNSKIQSRFSCYHHEDPSFPRPLSQEDSRLYEKNKVELLEALLSPDRENLDPASFFILGGGIGGAVGIALGLISFSLFHLSYLPIVGIFGCVLIGGAVALLLNHYLPVSGDKSFQNADKAIVHLMMTEHRGVYDQQLATAGIIAADNRSPAGAQAAGRPSAYEMLDTDSDDDKAAPAAGGDPTSSLKRSSSR